MINKILVVISLLLLAACSGEEAQVSEPVAELQTPVEQTLEILESPYEKSIAVLPFSDLSENSDQEYFSDGLSEDLISHLAMMPDLQVAGRESSFITRAAMKC